MKRLLIVYNPNSSQYIHVEKEILSKITKLGGRMVGKFTIEKAPFEHNVKRLTRVLRNGDFVLSAGGDATAAVCANAILDSDKDVTLAVLPYGNFNDLARTLGTKTMEDVLPGLKIIIESGAKAAVVINLDEKESQVAIPVTLSNGKYRDAVTKQRLQVKKGVLKGTLAPMTAYILYK